jgi:hypothetical protein
VDLLKMDCEGAEMEALSQAGRDTLQRFATILLEFHEFAGIDIVKVSRHLREAGFVQKRLTFDQRGDSGLAWFSLPPA